MTQNDKTKKQAGAAAESGKNTSADNEKKGPLVEAAENIEEGARVVGEKVSDITSTIAGKTSEIAGPVMEKVKDSVSDLADLSKKALDGLTQTAQDYVEKYKHKTEMKKISEERKELAVKLGSIIYVRHKVKNIGSENLFRHQEIQRLIKDMEEKDREIIRIGRKLDDA